MEVPVGNNSVCGKKSRYYCNKSDDLLGACSLALDSSSTQCLHVSITRREENDLSSSLRMETIEPSKIRKELSFIKEGSGRYRVHRVSCTPQNHVQVLFWMHRSAFP